MFLLAGCLRLAARALRPERGGGDAPPKQNAEAARWEALDKQLKTLREDVDDLRRRRDTDDKARAVEVEALKERLDRIDRSLESLRSTTRQSSAFTPATPGPTGTIRLENRSGVGATFILNGKSYRLAPLETMSLAAQPAGNFNYYVLAEGFGEIRAPVTRALAPGETFSIVINP